MQFHYSVSMLENSQQINLREEFDRAIQNPPCELYMDVNNLLSNHKKKISPRYLNSFVLYRRNKSAERKGLNQKPCRDHIKVICKKWREEPANIKRFYKILSTEARRRRSEIIPLFCPKPQMSQQQVSQPSQPQIRDPQTSISQPSQTQVCDPQKSRSQSSHQICDPKMFQQQVFQPFQLDPQMSRSQGSHQPSQSKHQRSQQLQPLQVQIFQPQVFQLYQSHYQQLQQQPSQPQYHQPQQFQILPIHIQQIQIITQFQHPQFPPQSPWILLSQIPYLQHLSPYQQYSQQHSLIPYYNFRPPQIPSQYNFINLYN